MNKKAIMDIKSVGVTLVVVGILAIVGVLVFAKVDNSMDSQINQWDTDVTRVVNESIVPLVGVAVVPGNVPLAECFELYNGTDQVPAVNWSCTSVGLVLVDPQINNSADVTLIYDYNKTGEAWQSRENVRGVVLDSMSLAVIGLIVLAAVAILGILFMIGNN